ncbi:MAG: hypothetical protein O4859_10350, partial [Trichodesmium sp. St18_bin1]|nr:hypothetical protein [Trichodesmium sp. St18_bin1]
RSSAINRQWTRGGCPLRIIQKNHIACAMERVELVKKICLLYRQKYLSRTAMVIDQIYFLILNNNGIISFMISLEVTKYNK